MAILYIAAEASELQPFAARLTGRRPLKWPLDYAQEGILDGRRILLAANGAGPKLATRALEIAIRAISAADLQSSVLEAVFCVGFCGALQPDLREGQIVVATEIKAPGSTEVFPAWKVEAEQAFVSGTFVSQDRVAAAAVEKAELRDRFGAIAVEMEAFGVAARAKRAGLPFCCIKAVSDRADESFGIDVNRTRSPDGRISRVKIVLQGVARPSLIPELFRLKRRADLAAGALGDFLVSCRFIIQSAGSVVPVDDSVDAN
jgi:adenosylhomocysteine nucleosidase